MDAKSQAPTTLDRLLGDVGRAWERPEQAQVLIERALRDFPDEEEAYVAAYRFYFYRNDLSRALAVAEDCLARVLGELGLPADWRNLSNDGSDFTDFERPRHRFLMFALSAYAYLLARLRRHADADLAFAVLVRLDPADRFGAARLRQVMSRGPDPESD